MAAEVFILQKVIVDKQVDKALFIVHQAQHTDRAGSYIQKTLHLLGGGKGETSCANLL